MVSKKFILTLIGVLILFGLSQVVFADDLGVFLVHGNTRYNVTESTGPDNWTAGYGCFDDDDGLAATNNYTQSYNLSFLIFSNADAPLTNITLTLDTKYLNWTNDVASQTNETLLAGDGVNPFPSIVLSEAILELANATSTLANSSFLELGAYVTVNYSLCDEVVTEIEIRAFNNTVEIDNSTLNLTIGVDSRPPRITFLNATDGINNLTDDAGSFNGTSWLLNNSNIIIVIEADDNNNGWGLTNETTLCFANNNDTGMENCVDNVNIGTMERTNATSQQAHNTTKNIYHFVLDAANFSNGTGANLSFVVWVEDVFNHSKTYNNTNIWYSFRFDGENPTSSLTLPSDTTIFTRRSIDLTCDYSDGYSGINGTVLRVTKPGGSQTDYSLGTTTRVTTLTGDDTNQAGTYSAQCLTDDNIRLSGPSSSGTFTVSHLVSVGGGAAAGAGAISVDADFSKPEVTKRSFVKTKGSAIEFSLDGKTEHKIKIEEVTGTSVKLTIASTPSEATLNIGESVEVDVDGNGVKDIKITLKSTEIEKQKVTLDVEKISSVVEEPKVEEVEEVTGEEVIGEAPSSKTGLMVAVAIILIGIIVYFLMFGKKKKKK